MSLIYSTHEIILENGVWVILPAFQDGVQTRLEMGLILDGKNPT